MTKLERLGQVKTTYVNYKAEFKDKGDLCLVYSVWGHNEYVNICYHSILAQLKFTDIQDYNLLVFVGRSVADYAIQLLSRVIPITNIIPIDDHDTPKHIVCCNELLKRYDVVCISDADNLMQATRRINLYEILLKEHESKEVTFLFRSTDAANVFASRMFLTDFESLEDYASFFPELTQYIQDKNLWFYSGFMAFNTQVIPQLTEEMSRCAEHKIICDETVWMSACIKNSIPMLDLSTAYFGLFRFVHPGNIDMVKHKEDDTIYFVHPFLGDFNDKIQTDILSYTLSKFK